MTTHADENSSTSQGSPDFSDAAATPSGDIKIEKIEGHLECLEDAETEEEQELADVKINEETEELVIKEELEEKPCTDEVEIMKIEVENEENEDFFKDLKENNEEDNEDFFFI